MTWSIPMDPKQCIVKGLHCTYNYEISNNVKWLPLGLYIFLQKPIFRVKKHLTQILVGAAEWFRYGAFHLSISLYLLRSLIPSFPHDSAYHLHIFFTPLKIN